MDSIPIKYFINDLINKCTPLMVWLQGTIEETIGNDTLILSDITGRAKITNCSTADAIDKSALKKGAYCCIIGTATNTKSLIEVQATKFIDFSSKPLLKLSWETEVKDAQLYLQGKILPSVEK